MIKKVNFQVQVCTKNKIHKIFCVLEGKFTQIRIKFGGLMHQFCVCYSNIYNLYMYKHKTVRNRLIRYLIFILVNWNLETTNRLTGYSVKVHSTPFNHPYLPLLFYLLLKISRVFNFCWVSPETKKFLTLIFSQMVFVSRDMVRTCRHKPDHIPCGCTYRLEIV